MPELPEVETVRRGLQDRIVGRRIAEVVIRREGLRFPFPASLKTLSGVTVEGIRRRAKYLLLETPSGWWGAEAKLISDDLAKVFNIPQNAGLLIQRVAISSPAHKLGIVPGRIPAKIGKEDLIVGGDIVLEVAGAKIEKDAEAFERIRKRIHEMRPTDTVEVKVLRDGKVIDLSIARGTW